MALAPVSVFAAHALRSRGRSNYKVFGTGTPAIRLYALYRRLYAFSRVKLADILPEATSVPSIQGEGAGRWGNVSHKTTRVIPIAARHFACRAASRRPCAGSARVAAARNGVGVPCAAFPRARPCRSQPCLHDQRQRNQRRWAGLAASQPRSRIASSQMEMAWAAQRLVPSARRSQAPGE